MKLTSICNARLPEQEGLFVQLTEDILRALGDGA